MSPNNALAIQESELAPVSPSGYERTLVLVSCGSRKATCTLPARSLYTSALFQKSVCWVEKRGLPWFVLSARHGLLHPNGDVAPYDQTLNHMSPSERQQWARCVQQQLLALAQGWGVERLKIVLLAGAAYAGWVPLVQTWCTVTEPMKGMQIGRRLQWLNQQLNCAPDTPMCDTTGMSGFAGADAVRYERLERMHLGDPHKQTGIYAQRLESVAVATEPEADGLHEVRSGSHGA